MDLKAVDVEAVDVSAVDVDSERAAGVEVLVHVRLEPTTPPELFAAYLRTEKGVLSAWHTAGDIDFELHLRCGGLADLHELLTRARCVGGAAATTTHLILHRLPSPIPRRPQTTGRRAVTSR